MPRQEGKKIRTEDPSKPINPPNPLFFSDTHSRSSFSNIIKRNLEQHNRIKFGINRGLDPLPVRIFNMLKERKQKGSESTCAYSFIYIYVTSQIKK